MSEPKKRNAVRWVIFGFAGICLLFAGGAAYVALQIIEGGPNQEGGIMGPVSYTHLTLPTNREV